MMKYLIGLLCFFSVAQAQYAPTSAKTKFVNGIGIGSKDTSQFTAADTIVLTIARDSVMYYKYRGFWRPIATGGNLSAYKLISDTLFNNGYTTRARLKQGLDSLAAIKGTVNSVGLTMPSAFSVANSPITNSGTIAVTAAGNATQYIRGDGALATLPTSGSGGGASVSYYLNGSVNQGTFVGNAYYEMNKTPIIGAGTDFTINANGYIAQFITDANDPALLKIPAGNWNFETFFSASSGGGSPTYYIELYKYNGTTFTLIASNSGSPKLISDGTNIEAYFSALAVPETVLNLTDRLAIRIYVSHSGRTIKLHTENSHLCQIITTFTTGLSALNGLTEQVQYLATGTSGTDFNIASSVATHTFNLPTASATNRGALSSTNWTTFNNKIGAGDTAAMLSPYYRTATATAALATKLNISDTASMLTGYTRLQRFNDSLIAIQGRIQTKQPLGNYITLSDSSTILAGRWLPNRSADSIAVIRALANTKLNITDTSAMLANRLRISDTSNMLSPYRRTSTLIQQSEVNGLTTSLNGKLNISDTASMLVSRPLNNRFLDSIATIRALAQTKGVGTLTSVATNTGSGITGGTITTSGTIAADTSILSTKANVTALLLGKESNLTFSTGLSRVGNTVTSTITQYTDALARAALSFTAGSGAYNSTTGVITIPANTSQLTNGANFITLADSSTILAGRWLPNRSADSIAVIRTLANTKQNIITLTTTGTSGAATLVGSTLNIPQYSGGGGGISGSGAANQLTYWDGTSSVTGNATLTYSPTSQLLINNSITASGAIARGINLTPTLNAAANNDVLVGLDINPTFNNSSFTSVSNAGIRIGGQIYIGQGKSNISTNFIIGSVTSGRNITIGGNNTIFGSLSGSAITSGNSNTAFGSNTLTSITTTSNNTAIGLSVLSLNTGSGNTVVGSTAMGTSGAGSNNVAIGFGAGNLITSAGNSAALGANSLATLTSGSFNVALGGDAGRYSGASGTTANQTSSGSIYLGFNTRASANGNTNEIVIAGYTGSGNGQVGLGSNTTSIGNSSTASTYLYGRTILGNTVDNGTDRLQVNGSISATGATLTGALSGTSASFSTGLVANANANSTSVYKFDQIATVSSGNALVGRWSAVSGVSNGLTAILNGANTVLNFAMDGTLSLGGALSGTDINGSGRFGATSNQTSPSDGSAYFYKSASGAVASGFQFLVETGSAGSRATRLTVDNTGAATFSSTLGINGTADNVKGGNYTPTASGAVNLTVNSVGSASYVRVGNYITVSGVVSVTTSGAGDSFAYLTVPFGSSSSGGAGSGTAYSSGFAYLSTLIAIATGDKIIFQFYAPAARSYDIYYTYTYKM